MWRALFLALVACGGDGGSSDSGAPTNVCTYESASCPEAYCPPGDEEYTRITTGSGTYLISKHLKYFETRLSNTRFFRIHKSYILNLEFIRSMVKTEGGHVLMTNEKLIPIGRSRRREFSLLMGI